MTSLNLATPYSTHTRISLIHSKNSLRNPVLSSFKKHKQTYLGLNIFLSWAEKIVRPETAHFLSSKHKVLKLHSSTLAIPGWFENAFKLSQDLKEMKKAKTGKARWEAIKTIFFRSLDLTDSSISTAQVLDDTHIVDLTELSHSLPHTLSGIGSVVNMVLKTNNLYQKAQKCHLPSSCKEAQGWAMHLDMKKTWGIIEASSALLGCCMAVLSTLHFFFSIVFPFYLLLSITTYTFFVWLVGDQLENINL
jgi:hypothetical protein